MGTSKIIWRYLYYDGVCRATIKEKIKQNMRIQLQNYKKKSQPFTRVKVYDYEKKVNNI